MADQSPRGMAESFFRACVLILAGIAALWLALSLLAKIWIWLLLAALVTGIVVAAIWLSRNNWGRRY